MKESMVSKKYTSLIGEKYAIFNLKNLDFQKNDFKSVIPDGFELVVCDSQPDSIPD